MWWATLGGFAIRPVLQRSDEVGRIVCTQGNFIRSLSEANISHARKCFLFYVCTLIPRLYTPVRDIDETRSLRHASIRQICHRSEIVDVQGICFQERRPIKAKTYINTATYALTRIMECSINALCSRTYNIQRHNICPIGGNAWSFLQSSIQWKQ